MKNKNIKTTLYSYAKVTLGCLFIISFVWPAVSLATNDHQALLTEQSYRIINISPNKGITVTAKFLNSGSELWHNSGPDRITLKSVSPSSLLRHPFWPAADTVGPMLESTVLPGESARFKFALQAPVALGIFDERFMLARGSRAIPGSMLELTINVTLNTNARSNQGVMQPTVSPKLSAPLAVKKTDVITAISPQPVFTSSPVAHGRSNSDIAPEPVNENTTELVENTKLYLEAAPIMRVGLYSTAEPVIITSSGTFGLADPQGKILKEFGAGTLVTAGHESENYFIKLPQGKSNYNAPLQFVPLQSSSIFEIVNLEDRPSWNPGLNFNKFRGKLEVNLSNKTGKTWVINELHINDYLKGLKETSNVSHNEFQKAMSIAARTYGVYHWERKTKHLGDNFDVDAIWDQVYKGYNSEKILPNFAKAVDETGGVIVTHNGELAITPYFSQSDGRTRAWSEVWGGEVAWLQAVDVPWDIGNALWGHGVGLSARAAINMANEGMSYDQILKYFYHGIDLEKIY